MHRTWGKQTAAAFGAALLLVAGTACEKTGPAADPAADAAASGDGAADTTLAVNALTEEEQGEGWRLLFDGQSLEGWRGYKQDSIPSGWGVQDGALHATGENGGGDLLTRDQFDNFELALEWKIAAGGNSGIVYRVTEAHESSWETGPEMQILDDAAHPEVAPNTLAGSNYALHEAVGKTLRPVGEWNQARLVVNGPHVEHWLNGVKVVEYELWSDDWKSRVAASKFVDMPDYGMARSGHLALQDHGDPVWFRNIKIRPLGATAM